MGRNAVPRKPMSDATAPPKLVNRAPDKRVKLTLLLASTLTVMAGASVTAAVPAFQQVFSNVPQVEILSRLVLTLPALFIGLIAPFSGYLIDRIGRKRVLVGGVALYVLAGTSGLYIDSLYGILIGRAFLGVAVAGTMTTVTTLVGDNFEGLPRQRFIGLQGGIMALSGLLFTTLGGGLADIVWRAPFAIYLLALLYLPMIMAFIRESKPAETAAEAAGQGKTEPNGNGAAPQRAAEAYPKKTIFALYGIAFAGMVMFFMLPTQVPDYVAEKTQVSNLLKGLAVGIGTLTGSLVSMNYQRIKRRLHFLGVFAVFFTVTGAGFLLLGLADTYPAILVGGLVAGLGAGLLMPNSNFWLVELAPDHMRGRLVGGLTMAIFLGQFASPLIMTPLGGVFGSMSPVFLIASGVMLSGAITFAMLELRQRRLGRADEPAVPGWGARPKPAPPPKRSGEPAAEPATAPKARDLNR
jgi:MFS family permease